MTKNSKCRPARAVAIITLTSFLWLPYAGAQSLPTASMGAMQSGAGMQRMMSDMNEKMSSMKMTGMPDVDFAMAMRVHHQGAIQMAQAELRDGKEPQMRVMAKDIIYAQKKEIAQLDMFLAKRGHAIDMMGKKP
jgi:uncharacterized protein (DUF305 family)